MKHRKRGVVMKRSGLIYLIVATILFSSMEVAIKATDGAFNAIQLNFLRFAIGALVLLPMAIGQLKRAGHRLTKKDWRDFSVLGFCMVVISLSFYTLSIEYIPAYKVAILFSSNTFFSILLASIFLREKISRQSKGALFIAFIGMMIIVNPLQFKGSPIGIVLILISAVTFSIYGVFAKKLTGGKSTGGNVMTCFAFITGSLELFVFMMISHIRPVADFLIGKKLDVLANIPVFAGLGMDNLLLFIFISVFVTGVGFAAYFLAIDTLSVAMASLVFFIKPVLSPLIAYIFIGEVISLRNIIGLCFIVAGSTILFIYNLRNIKRADKDMPISKLVERDISQNIVDIREEAKRNIVANEEAIRNRKKK